MLGPHRKIRISKELMGRLFTRDDEGNRLSIDWGIPDADGFYIPTISVDYEDNIVAQLEIECNRLYGIGQEYEEGRKQLKEALEEQLLKRGYAFRGRCDAVPEDIERAFNAMGICTEEHKRELASNA